MLIMSAGTMAPVCFMAYRSHEVDRREQNG
jgi:hypothetical protein